MIKITLITLLLTLSAHGEEFQSLKKQPHKIACSQSKGIISFADIKKPYAMYDKNSRSIKIVNCEKIQIKDFSFYTAVFSSELMEGTEPQKVLTYEIALLDKKSNSLITVRSETIDQLDTSGDAVEAKFEIIFKNEWGTGKKDGSILLKIDAHEKNEKSEPYTLKFNAKAQWFEDHFEKTPAKK